MLSVLLLLATVGLAVGFFRTLRAGDRAGLTFVLGLALAAVAVAWAVVTGWYELRKLIGVCMMPMGLLWLALLALGWRLTASGHRRLGVATWAFWLAIGLAGNGRVGDAMIGWLEHDYATVDPLQLEGFDAVLVLGGGVTRAAHGQVTLGESGDRVMLAARLYHTGKVQVLVTSGPPFPPGAPTTSIPRLTARVWQDLGIPADAIVLVEGPRSTRAEIERFEPILGEQRWRRVGLLTSAYHLRRATGLCARRGITVVPLPANLRGVTAPLRPRDLVPQAAGFGRVQLACWEFLGAAAGR